MADFLEPVSSSLVTVNSGFGTVKPPVWDSYTPRFGTVKKSVCNVSKNLIIERFCPISTARYDHFHTFTVSAIRRCPPPATALITVTESNKDEAKR